MAMVDVAGDLPADNGLTGQVGWLGLRPTGDQAVCIQQKSPSE